MLLFARELLRHRDPRDDVQVAVSASADVRHALAAQPEARAGLRASRDVQVLAALQRRHLHGPAEGERREVDWLLAIEIVIFTLDEWMFLHVHDDVEIAGRATGGAVFSLAREAHLLAGRDPGGDLHRQLALLGDPAHAPAGRAGFRYRLAGAAARRARPCHGEKPLL